MIGLADIPIRDPFVLRVDEEQAYYLFGSTDPNIWDGPGIGFDCYRSVDLVEWVGPIAAFRPPPDFWSPGCYWAPEVHRVGDGWFMFATFTPAAGHKGTAILRSSRPEGPYLPWSDGAVTPQSWPCLDGTLHVEADGRRWLVYCHEFTQCSDGEICAQRLAGDLRTVTGEPVVLLRASAATWARPFDGVHDAWEATPPFFVTDGPFLHRTAAGELTMLWSSFGDRGYAVGVARSDDGSLTGPWRQDPEPLWAEDGGHGMVFRTFEGRLRLALHQPNITPDERAVFVDVADDLSRIE